jgi:hypothetical protein
VHGIWGIDELYDLQEDPEETRNLIFSPAHAAIARDMNTRLFQILADTEGRAIPLQPDRNTSQRRRSATGAPAADFLVNSSCLASHARALSVQIETVLD